MECNSNGSLKSEYLYFQQDISNEKMDRITLTKRIINKLTVLSSKHELSEQEKEGTANAASTAARKIHQQTNNEDREQLNSTATL